jgi:hypothetical protein
MESMSAAATAAGYLYASGRLRARSKEGEEADRPETRQAPVKRRTVRIAGVHNHNEAAPQVQDYQYQSKPEVRTKPAVRIQYRVRRWRPDEAA